VKLYVEAAAEDVAERRVRKIKTTLHLSREASQLLSIHCAMLGRNRSEMIGELINTYLVRYEVSDQFLANEIG
jgi:predicted DNA-binding protein